MIRRALPYLLVILVVSGALIGAYLHGYQSAAHVYGEQMAKTNAAFLAESARLQADAREAEAQHAADMADLDDKHTKEMRNAKAAADRDIAELRAGAIRVRDRFTCPAIPAGGASQVGTGAGLGDATPRGGLQAADAELVLRIAGEADEVAVQLAACQAIVRGDRGEQ